MKVFSSFLLQSFFLISSCFVFSQNSLGIWDTKSSFSQVINLSAGEYRPITFKLPQGTTKVYYRIEVVSQIGNTTSTFLEQFYNSTNPKIQLASRLTNTTIKMSDPKISYSILFASASGTNQCFDSNGVITGEQINSLGDDACINTNDISGAFVFKFKSENSYFPLKIKFEIIPFINYELSRGWAKNLKDVLYDILVKGLSENNTENYSIIRINEISNCILVNITKDFTVKQFQNLAEYEKQNYIMSLKPKCDN